MCQMKSMFVSSIMLSILVSGFIFDVDDHTSGRGSRPMSRESMTETYTNDLQSYFSIDM